jgi:hypothetical protein
MIKIIGLFDPGRYFKEIKQGKVGLPITTNFEEGKFILKDGRMVSFEDLSMGHKFISKKLFGMTLNDLLNKGVIRMSFFDGYGMFEAKINFTLEQWHTIGGLIKVSDMELICEYKGHNLVFDRSERNITNTYILNTLKKI